MRAAGAVESHASQRRPPHPAPLYWCVPHAPYTQPVLIGRETTLGPPTSLLNIHRASGVHHAALKLIRLGRVYVDEARERALASEMAAEGTLHPGLRALPGSRTAVVRAVSGCFERRALKPLAFVLCALHGLSRGVPRSSWNLDLTRRVEVYTRRCG